jgi:hypothetical protein
VALAACAAPGAATGSRPAAPTTASAAVPVIQVRISGGGFTPPAADLARIPAVTIWADGRVIGEGPEPAIYPGPALPNLLERRLAPAEVRDLQARAVAAGVLEVADVGSPAIADGTTTRITVTTPAGTAVRDVYALLEGTPEQPGGPWPGGLTPQQQAARARLAGFVRTLTDGDAAPGAGPSVAQWRPYATDRVAVLARPWAPDPVLPDGPARPWPGPPLPGPQVATTRVDCVLAAGAQGRAVLDTAGTASSATRWTTSDGQAWRVRLRPLLPSESGCADLATG